jgi:anaerobic selenocysteine-containing dehydrogenase
MYTDDDGKLIRVEGDPENPYNSGRLCSRCLALPEVVYNEGRILYPMKRDPKDRGKDKWQRVSWEEAMDLIYEKFEGYRQSNGAESCVFATGTSRDIATYVMRLTWSFGSPHWLFMISGMSCFAPRIAGMFATTGVFLLGDYSQQFADRYDNPEWRTPETIVVWGCNPIVSNSDGLFGHWVVDCMKLGSKLIVIDPRCTWLASKAEHFLQIRPGTDAALAMGMLNVIISEDLYDHDFVDKWCYGFDELADAVKEFTPEETEKITWIPKDKIIAAARFYTDSESAITQWGVSVDMTKEAMPANQAIAALFEITGNVEKPGSMIVPPNVLFFAGGWGNEFLTPEQQKKKAGYDKYPLVGQAFHMTQTDELVAQIETGKPYELKALFFLLTNFLACTGADPQRTIKAFRNFEFIAATELFMTPTVMALADVVLPGATYPERDGIRIGDGAQRGETINKAIEPLGECRSDMEIVLELGRRFAPEAWPWNNTEEMYDTIFKDTGYTFKEMQEVSPAFVPFEYYKHEKGMLRADGQPGFETPTGRLELWSTFYSQLGLSPLPYFEEPSPGPVSTPELLDEYPLILTTGARQWASFHSEHRQIPHLRALHPDATVYMHPSAAEKCGVDTGDWVWVENQRGRCKRRVETTKSLLEDVVSTDHAWWLPEAPAAEEDGLFGLWDMACNQLLPYIPGKAGLGTNYRTMLCKIYKVKEGEHNHV